MKYLPFYANFSTLSNISDHEGELLGIIRKLVSQDVRSRVRGKTGVTPVDEIRILLGLRASEFDTLDPSKTLGIIFGDSEGE